MLGVRRLAWPELQRLRKASNAHRTASSEVFLSALSRCSAQESAQVEGIRNLFVRRLSTFQVCTGGSSQQRKGRTSPELYGLLVSWRPFQPKDLPPKI